MCQNNQYVCYWHYKFNYVPGSGLEKEQKYGDSSKENEERDTIKRQIRKDDKLVSVNTKRGSQNVHEEGCFMNGEETLMCVRESEIMVGGGVDGVGGGN